MLRSAHSLRRVQIYRDDARVVAAAHTVARPDSGETLAVRVDELDKASDELFQPCVVLSEPWLWVWLVDDIKPKDALSIVYQSHASGRDRDKDRDRDTGRVMERPRATRVGKRGTEKERARQRERIA